MKKYQYTDPVDNGCTKIKLSRKQHDKLFPNRKRSIFTHYDYYIGDDKMVLHRTTSLFWKTVVTIGFPVVILGYGIFNFKEVLKEYHELYNQKRLGHFGADECWSNTDTYAAVAQIAKYSGQWG